MPTKLERTILTWKPPDLLVEARAAAVEDGMTLTALVRAAVELYLRNRRGCNARGI